MVLIKIMHSEDNHSMQTMSNASNQRHQCRDVMWLYIIWALIC